MKQPHLQRTEEVLDASGTDLAEGLSQAEVSRRRHEHGPNRLRKARRKRIWLIVVDQFKSVIVWLLAGAAALSFSFGDWSEGAAILAVLAINAAIGFTTELKAVRSMEALRRLSRVQATVRRDGKTETIAADDIVPGDIVLLTSGSIVPADLRLVEAGNLQCDESALTGESVPVAKNIDPLDRDAPPSERINMAFKGTSVTRGSGTGVVVATGMATELGRISELAEEAEGQASPLEKRLDRLGGQLVWATLALTGLIAAIGVYAGQDLLNMVKTAVALAVAAVPEGLPIVATVALARGMWRMARRNALIERLSAVETLGATTVILADKTGTLTENRMTVVRLLLATGEIEVEPDEQGNPSAFVLDGKRVEAEAGSPLYSALQVSVLCNNASLSDRQDKPGAKGAGDPMEFALLVAGKAGGLEQQRLLREMPKVREESFDPGTKMMATFNKKGDRYLVAAKGAPEAVIAHSSRLSTDSGTDELDDAGRQQWREHNERMAFGGLRVLGLAMKEAASKEEEPYEDLTLLGLIGLIDPPRADVADAIAACRTAGMRVVMLTGDHAGTARNVATEVGIADEDAIAIEASELKDVGNISEEERQRVLQAAIFSRVSPETKLQLVSLHQKSGAVVAMTGDGVNDAPALKKADIGIAMGLRGTDVAREAADMVLRDDAFPSIVAAICQGRIIFGNIRKFVVYLLSCNLSEIMVIGLAAVSGLPLPLLPLQILYLNLVTDVFPAFALGVGEGEAEVMRRPPRDPQEPILGLRRWAVIGGYGAVMACTTLGAFFLARTTFQMADQQALTISFLTLALTQVWHVFNMRDRDANPIVNEVTTNPFVWGALALCAALIAAAVYLPGLSDILGMAPPGMTGLALALGASLLPLLIGQVALVVIPLVSSRFQH